MTTCHSALRLVRLIAYAVAMAHAVGCLSQPGSGATGGGTATAVDAADGQIGGAGDGTAVGDTAAAPSDGQTAAATDGDASAAPPLDAAGKPDADSGGLDGADATTDAGPPPVGKLLKAALACKLLGNYNPGPNYPLDPPCTTWPASASDAVSLFQTAPGGVAILIKGMEIPLDTVKSPCQFQGTACRTVAGPGGPKTQQATVYIAPVQNGATSSDSWLAGIEIDTPTKGKAFDCEGFTGILVPASGAAPIGCSFEGQYQLDAPPQVIADTCGKSWSGDAPDVLAVAINDFGIEFKLAGASTSFSGPKPKTCAGKQAGTLDYTLNGVEGVAKLSVEFGADTVVGTISMQIGSGSGSGCSGSWTLAGKKVAGTGGGPSAGKFEACPGGG